MKTFSYYYDSIIARYYYNTHTLTFPQTVTFQCILATDGTNSFVFFLYGNGAIDSVRLSTAQVGLNAGNGIDFVSVDGSLTSSIFNIDGDSNVGCPGVFVYQVNGDFQQPQPGRQCSINSCK